MRSAIPGCLTRHSLLHLDSEFFQKDIPDYHDDRKSNPEQTENYILCAGYYKRDWDTLIKAYDQLDTQVKLRLIGNADLKTENPNIEVWGAVPVEEFKRQIEGALFCILPLQQLFLWTDDTPAADGDGKGSYCGRCL